MISPPDDPDKPRVSELSDDTDELPRRARARTSVAGRLAHSALKIGVTGTFCARLFLTWFFGLKKLFYH